MALPEEHYLRGLADLDLDDPEAIADFSARYGKIGRADWADLPLTRPIELDGYDYDEALKSDEEPVWSFFDDTVDGCLSYPNRLAALLRRHCRTRYGETLQRRAFFARRGVRLYAQVLRDATRIWMAHRGVITYGEMLAAEGEPASDARAARQRRTCPTGDVEA